MPGTTAEGSQRQTQLTIVWHSIDIAIQQGLQRPQQKFCSPQAFLKKASSAPPPPPRPLSLSPTLSLSLSLSRLLSLSLPPSLSFSLSLTFVLLPALTSNLIVNVWRRGSSLRIRYHKSYLYNPECGSKYHFVGKKLQTISTLYLRRVYFHCIERQRSHLVGKLFPSGGGGELRRRR